MDSTTSSASSSLEIVVLDFKPFPKNTLVGFFNLSLPAVGLTLCECTFHRSEGKSWVGLPARSYEVGGVKKWMRLVEATDKSAHFRFQAVAVKAIENYLANLQKPVSTLPRASIPPAPRFPR